MDRIKSLDYFSLNSTLLELNKVGKIELGKKISFILENNEREKPDKHNRKDDIHISTFDIDLEDDEYDEITDLFFDLEVASLDNDGEATEKTNYYVDLVNKWSSLSH